MSKCSTFMPQARENFLMALSSAIGLFYDKWSINALIIELYAVLHLNRLSCGLYVFDCLLSSILEKHFHL